MPSAQYGKCLFRIQQAVDEHSRAIDAVAKAGQIESQGGNSYLKLTILVLFHARLRCNPFVFESTTYRQFLRTFKSQFDSLSSFCRTILF